MTPRSTPASTLALFRILFGLLMVAESWGAIATGWVAETFVLPRHTFPMAGLEGLRVLSGPLMYGYFGAMGVAALGVALGLRYRVSGVALATLWSGAYLAQKSHYNNHYYLAVLVAWWMAALPAHRARSLDVRAGRVERATHLSPWVGRLFRLQLLVVFSYAAVNKLYPGWLSGDYLRTNLGAKGDTWLVGPLLVEPWFQSFIGVSGIAFDALVVPALLVRRTRWIGVLGLLLFNLFNSLVFRIGIFPYMVLAWLVFFFEDRFRSAEDDPSSPAQRVATPWLRPAVLAFVAVQIALPLRHHLIPGDVNWTEGGHRMSWRMMLRTKSGALKLLARSPAVGRVWTVPQHEFLNVRQQVRVASNPEFLMQFVRILERHYAEEEGIDDLELRAVHSAVSLNGAPAQPLYDPDVDLCEERWHHGLEREPWVLDPAR
ncbi:MAG: HTTM domain-containing protein [Planctomycetota bacterium]